MTEPQPPASMDSHEQSKAGEGPTAPALPDYVLSPDAVFSDTEAQWRYGRPPDYSQTRRVWKEGRKSHHAANSLPFLVENLVKNWEVEASFKPRLEDWRTVDRSRYTFAMSGGPPQSAEHMLKVGTYNAIIAPNEYYDPSHSDFASSHKTFKRMMPTFAWEVMEVFSGPPQVVFRWRHWGEMKSDYVGFNNKGQKVTAKAHGGSIEIFGTTIAVVDDQLRVISLDTYVDSLDMFRQIAPHGVVNMTPINHKVPLSDALDADAPGNDGIKIAEAHRKHGEDKDAAASEDLLGKHASRSTGQPAGAFVPGQGACPFMGSSGMSGVEAPHPLPSQPQNDAMSLDPQPADTHFSDYVLVGSERVVPETLPPIRMASQMETPTQQGARVDLQPRSTANVTTLPTQSSSKKRPASSSPQPAPLISDDGGRSSIYSSAVTGVTTKPIKTARRTSFVDESTTTGKRDQVDETLERPARDVHPHGHHVEAQVQPAAGEAVVAPVDAEETKEAKAEMSQIRGEEVEVVMNRE